MLNTRSLSILVLAGVLASGTALAQRTEKPVLHGKHWVAITGKPLGATAGAMMFQKGGNAVDAACAMLGATATMYDTLGWGGETQTLIYHPGEKRVIGINALGVAPTGATPEYFKSQGMDYPPAYGPLAAVTPGTPGGLIVMLAEYGTLSLADVLAPSIEMAEGYPIEAQLADAIEREKDRIREWPYSRETFLTHEGQEREAPYPGEVFRQPDLKATLEKLVEAEQEALSEGKSRKDAIYAAYERFYRGDIAEEFVRGSREQGGLHTEEDLASWEVHIEEPVMTTYKDIEVYKLTHWVQGPVLNQTLNILEEIDVRSMGYNSSRYIHTLYQSMNLAFADRDFYYGDPYFPPEEPIEGLLSKDYARERRELIDWEKNDPDVKPGDPYPFQGGENPYRHHLDGWSSKQPVTEEEMQEFEAGFYAGTTSIQAADESGWVVSVTPFRRVESRHDRGPHGHRDEPAHAELRARRAHQPVQRARAGQAPAGDLDAQPGAQGRQAVSVLRRSGRGQPGPEPASVLPERRRVRDERPAGGGGRELQQLSASELVRCSRLAAGRLLLNSSVPPWVREELESMGYSLEFRDRTSGPINAIYFDWKHGTMWGGASHHGEDYGIAW